jgi:uncharacterized membrane protein
MNTLRYFHQPNISESLGNGWYIMKKYFLWLLLVVVITGIFTGSSPYTYKEEHGAFNPMMLFLVPLGVLFGLLVASVIRYGSSLIFLRSVRDIQPEIPLLFVGFQRNYLNIVIANLLVSLIVIAGFIFLIVPGFVFLCRLAFVPYLVMDRGLDGVKAIEESWRLTRGHGWTIFGLGCMSVLIGILGLICLVVGIFPAIIWISASFASLYQAVAFIDEKENAPSAEPIYQI